MAMPSATAQQIVTFALRKLGVVDRRMPVQVADMQDGLEALWMLLDGLSREPLIVPYWKTVSYTSDGSSRVLTIGDGGNFDTICPLSIDSVQINSAGTIYNIDPMPGSEQFQNLTPYADLTQYPRFYLWNQSHPSQTITLSAELLDGDIISITGLFPFDATFSGAGQTVDPTSTSPNPVSLSLPAAVEFPVGFQSMLMWCLAEFMMPEYPQDNPAIAQQITTEAAKAKGALKNRNQGGRKLRFNDTNGSRNRYWGSIQFPYQG